MKKVLTSQILKRVKKLGIKHKRGIVSFLQKQSDHTMRFASQLIGLTSSKNLAMKEIRLALSQGPESIDF